MGICIHTCMYTHTHIFKENIEEVRNSDIVIIDISFENFEENAPNIPKLLNPAFHRRIINNTSL